MRRTELEDVFCIWGNAHSVDKVIKVIDSRILAMLSYLEKMNTIYKLDL